MEEGLQRCVNNEAFYLKLVVKAAEDPGFERLEKDVKENDLDDAFEAAHMLKGALANLALTPILEPVSEMVELLRNRTQTDYTSYLATISEKRDQLTDLIKQ